MEELVQKLKKIVPFKESTVVGDILLLASHDPQMVVYALVKNIEPDPSRKGAWWHITMHVLAVPPKEVVWTLREPQFTGQEIFTFGGVEHFMKSIHVSFSSVSPDPADKDNTKSNSPSRKRLRIVK